MLDMFNITEAIATSLMQNVMDTRITLKLTHQSGVSKIKLFKMLIELYLIWICIINILFEQLCQSTIKTRRGSIGSQSGILEMET